jgi:hypothetical protein
MHFEEIKPTTKKEEIANKIKRGWVIRKVFEM